MRKFLTVAVLCLGIAGLGAGAAAATQNVSTADVSDNGFVPPYLEP